MKKIALTIVYFIILLYCIIGGIIGGIMFRMPFNPYGFIAVAAFLIVLTLLIFKKEE